MISKEKINTGRQLELDVARGLAVLFMIFIHAQLFFANEFVTESYFGVFNDFVGMVPSAPMFMFLLGVGISYTRKSDPKIFFRRGLMLILSGYLLNFLKGFVPSLVESLAYGDTEYLYEGLYELLYVDILQFAGLAMIMFGFFKKIKANIPTILGFCAGFALLNLFLVDIKIDNLAITSVTGLIWESSEISYFPFLTWMFYPIAGYLLGNLLIRCEDKKKFYIICLVISAIVYLSGSYVFNHLMGLENGMLSDNGYYHHIITDNITFTGLILMEISLISFVTPFIPKFLQKIIGRWSKNVTSIFFIHWIIISLSALFIEANSLYMLPFVILLVIIIVSSDFLAELYSKIKKERNLKNE